MMANRTGDVTRIIACQVFKPVLEHLQLAGTYPNTRLTYLPSNLHMKPHHLRRYLVREMAATRRRNERIICLYGDCFPGIEHLCEQHGAIKVPGFHCYEMLLGSEQFNMLIEETAGNFFVERDLILNFEEHCAKPLELDDEEIRQYCFKHYQRVVYVRQPSDPDLTLKAREVAGFLGLSLEVRDADYSYLGKKLVELVGLR